MERRKFSAIATAFVTTLLLGKSTKLQGQTAAPGKTIEDIDAATGIKTTFTKVTGITDAQTDGVIYRKVGNEYFKRDYDGHINVTWFGAKGDGVTDDTDAFNKALATIERKTVYVPATINGYLIGSTVTIPNNKNLIGDGKGNGENSRSKITFTGTGVLFNVKSYYGTIKDLYIVSSSKSTADTTAFYLMVTQTIMENVAIYGFGVGIKNTFGHTTFAHFFKNMMITACGTGAYFDTANNVVFQGCFFDANTVCVKLNACNQVSFSGGTVMQTEGVLKTGFRGAEAIDSQLLDISNSGAISLRDCYFEIAAASLTPVNQKIATLVSVSGFNFTGNYYIGSFRPDQAPIFDLADDKSLAVNIVGNTFLRVGKGTFIVGVSGTGVGKQYSVNINNNRLSSNGFEIDNSFVPKLKISLKDDDSIQYATQTAYCTLDGGTVNVFGTIGLTRKGNSKGPLSIDFPLGVKKGLNIHANILGNLTIKNMANIKSGKCIYLTSGQLAAQLSDENNNRILMEDLTDNSVLTFSISYPYAQTAIGI